MRLWHSKLVPLLDNPRLSDLHMSCCNLRGLGWGKRNKNIDYIYEDELGEEALARYHQVVLAVMMQRGFNFDERWQQTAYCGKRRPARTVDYEKYKRAAWRDVPLKGHTLDLYLNDIKALRERGLYIMFYRYYDSDDLGDIQIYRAIRDVTETTYGIRLGGTKDGK